MNTFSLRKARSTELQTLIAIDDEASTLYEQAGLKFELGKDHPFAAAEAIRWAAAIERGFAHVAVDCQDMPIGFIALCFVDGEHYLDQLAVRRDNMRGGVGTALLRYAIAWSLNDPLWLTTYSHVLWNRPYYERHGFVVVPEHACGPELCAILQGQRSALPAPDQRVAMVRRCSSSDTQQTIPQ